MRAPLIVAVAVVALAVPVAASAKPQLLKVSSPVPRGSYASVTVRAGSHVFCSIRVHYGSRPPIAAAGLATKGGALFTGLIQWRWKMSSGATRGRWTVDVSCGAGGALRTSFLVV